MNETSQCAEAVGRLAEVQVADPPVEFTLTVRDPWSRQVFNALLRRYGLRPYRYLASTGRLGATT